MAYNSPPPPSFSSPSKYLSSEATKERKEELRKSKGKVLVEEVAQERRHPVVGPPTMHKK